MDAALALLGVAVAPEWRKLIRFQLAVSLAHARRVEAFVLPDEAEPAPVFHA
jgi:hypothetical protein